MGLNPYYGHRKWFANNYFLVKSKLNDTFCNIKFIKMKPRKDAVTNKIIIWYN